MVNQNIERAFVSIEFDHVAFSDLLQVQLLQIVKQLCNPPLLQHFINVLTSTLLIERHTTGYTLLQMDTIIFF